MILSNKYIKKINLFNFLLYKNRSSDGYSLMEEVVFILSQIISGQYLRK